MRVLAIIPARGGSKGLPGKNIRPLLGKPLIGWSVDVARAICPDVDICVSTDDPTIISTVEAMGLSVPFVRPVKLASDTATSNDVLIHALDFYRSKGIEYDVVLLLQPTSPLRTVEQVNEAIALYKQNPQCDMVASVRVSHASSVMCYQGDDGFLHPTLTNAQRRQDAPEYYEYNGAIYVINVQALCEKGLSKFDKEIKYVMPDENSIDIDTIIDFQLVEQILKNKYRNMFNIAIIGAGQLGSRHLQGLKKAQLNMSIQVVDSSVESLAIAKSRYQEIEENQRIAKIEFLTDITELHPSLDMVIVATSSMPRAAIVENLLEQKEVKNLVLEKFLFPSLSQYERIEKLLKQKGVIDRTWVNCTRRMFDHYSKLKTTLANESQLEMEVQGSNWGLCCNSVHYIDIFAYLTEQTEWKIEIDPQSTLTSSKRSGYVEIEGAMYGKSQRGDKITLIDNKNCKASKTIKLKNGSIIDIDEANGRFTIGGQVQNFVAKFQSQLTNTLAEDILIGNFCRLTPYTESQKIHKAFLTPIVEFYNNTTGNNSDSCPIT